MPSMNHFGPSIQWKQFIIVEPTIWVCCIIYNRGNCHGLVYRSLTYVHSNAAVFNKAAVLQLK